ncbi:MAG: VOC family protein, partial [Planctomycetes bacterium]|nr:VOC family protein [Planctomycetota bacterium]
MPSEESRPVLPITNVAQVAILVPDLDAAMKNFWERFAVGPWSVYTYDNTFVPTQNRHGKPTRYASRIGLANIGDLRIELIQPLEGDTVYSEFIEKHGYGVQHLGVLTKSMKDSVAAAQQAGFSITMDGSGFGLDGDGAYAYLDTEDLVNITFEFIERPKG